MLGVVIGRNLFILIPSIKNFMYMVIVPDPRRTMIIRAFYPLSLMHFFDYTTIDKRWAYPLRSLTAF